MLIIVSGPTGSGKTTTASLLKKKLRHVALVELDSLRDFIVDVPIDKAIPVVIEMAVVATRKLLQAGYTVILVYPLYDHHYQTITRSLGSWPIHSFVLRPQKKVIQPSRGKRKLIPWEKKRISLQYKTGLHNQKFGLKIDNSYMKPSSVVQEMLKYLPKKIIRS